MILKLFIDTLFIGCFKRYLISYLNIFAGFVIDVGDALGKVF